MTPRASATSLSPPPGCPGVVMGIDVGGTKTSAGLLSVKSGERLTSRVIPTEPRRGGRAVLDDVLGLVSALRTEVGAAAGELRALGLAVCELVDRHGRLASAQCIPWMDLPLLEELGALAPVVIEADVRAAALAEARRGAGRPFRIFLYLTIGTGISSCLMIEGSPFLGANGLTGTLASSSLGTACPHCGHSSTLTLEDVASGPGLAARYHAAGGALGTPREILAAAAAGEPLASRIVNGAGDALGAQVAHLVNTLDPEAVVVGGGLGLSDGPLWDRLLDSTRQRIWCSLQRDLPILHADTGTDAGWLGAALVATARFHSPPLPPLFPSTSP